MQQAVEMAKSADAVIVNVGNTGTSTASKKSNPHDRSISISAYSRQGGANNMRLSTFESLKIQG
jgi:DNA-binding transcriptional regulator LsrR (DeoR family)